MPLWPVTTEPIPPEKLGTFQPKEVLFEFDGLCTFTCRAVDGGLLLAHLCDEEDGQRRFLVAPTTDGIIARIKRGEMGIRAALDQARLWYVDLGHGDKPLRAYSTVFEDVPSDCLPTPIAFLAPKVETETALSVRTVGARIGGRVTTASVIKATANSAYAALKRLVDYLSSTANESPPAAWWKPFYDLPARQFKLASFEIQFGWPEPSAWPDGDNPQKEESDKIISDIARLLTAGVRWCESQSPDQLPGVNPEENRVILEAIELLSPPQTGSYIDRIVVGGMLTGTKNLVQLTKSTRKQIRGRLDGVKSPKEWTIVADGVVEVVDRGLDRFTLRRVHTVNFSGTPEDKTQNALFREFQFEYKDEWADVVFEAFETAVPVLVSGRLRTHTPSFTLYTLHGLVITDQNNGGQPIPELWRNGGLILRPVDPNRPPTE